MTKQFNEDGVQEAGRNRPDDGSSIDFSAEPASPSDGSPPVSEVYFPGYKDNELRANLPTIRIEDREHPIYRMTPEWVQAMKDFLNANVILPILATLVIITSVFLLREGALDQNHFVALVTACLTAVVVHKKKM